MKKKSREKWLSKLYAAHSPEEQAAVYDHWGLQYEADVLHTGYNMPQLFTGLTCRYVSSPEAPILDVGAGTGILGQALALLGYTAVEALDFSRGMLEVCEAKAVYTALHQLDITGALPLPDNRYAAVLAMGVFGKGHVSAETLHELSRITTTGGHLIYSIREDEYVPGGYKEVQENFEKTGEWKECYISEAFNSVPFDTKPILNRVLCFQMN